MATVYIRSLRPSDASSMLALRSRNRDFFKLFEPAPRAGHFTVYGQRDEIASATKDRKLDRAYAFGIFLDPSAELIGRVSLSNVARGAWQNATLGYYVGRDHNGKGYATKAVILALAFAFGEARLHRVQAGVMPDNLASKRVLEKAGFRREGFAKQYLLINGAWRDHDLYALTKEEWTAR